MALTPKGTWKFLAIAIGTPIICVGIFAFTPAIDELESRIPLQVNFALRHIMGLEPSLNPKIKILAFDDDSVRAFKRTAPRLATWQAILTQLSGYRPRMILIDKLFDLPEPKADYEGFVAALKALPTPVVIGAFNSPRKIQGREPLLLNRSFGQLSSIISDGTKMEDFDKVYPWIKERTAVPYGAPAYVVEAFAAIGHITYHDYFMVPILRFSGGRILSHWSFFPTGGPKLSEGGLIVNGHRVPLNPDGRFLINFLHQANFKSIIFSMAPLSLPFKSPGSELPILEDDIVLVLPGMYTGHADWVHSPLGEIPGGLLLASLVNCALNNEWLTVLSLKAPLVIGAAVVGGVLALTVGSGLVFWLVLFASIGGIGAGGLWSFSAFNLVLPWFSMGMGMAVTAVSAQAVKARIAEYEHYRLRQEFATAKLVQTQLFPPDTADLKFLQVVAKCMPAAECGGDFWNHFEVRDGRQYLLIGDAVGHGIPAALVAASTHATMMTIAEVFQTSDPKLLSPAYVLSHLNAVLVASFKSEITMTLFVAEFDRILGRLRFANAGHCQPFLLDPHATKGDGYQLLKSRGDPLGFDDETAYIDSSIALQPGCRLHFYTDGLIECRDKTGKILGAKKFTEHFRRSIALPSDQAIAGIFDLVRDFSQASILEDDGTIVIVETALRA